jgi:hypothetical protein
VPKGPKSGRASLKTRKGRASSKTRKGLVRGLPLGRKLSQFFGLPEKLSLAVCEIFNLAGVSGKVFSGKKIYRSINFIFLLMKTLEFH